MLWTPAAWIKLSKISAMQCCNDSSHWLGLESTRLKASREMIWLDSSHFLKWLDSDSERSGLWLDLTRLDRTWLELDSTRLYSKGIKYKKIRQTRKQRCDQRSGVIANCTACRQTAHPRPGPCINPTGALRTYYSYRRAWHARRAAVAILLGVPKKQNARFMLLWYLKI